MSDLSSITRFRNQWKTFTRFFIFYFYHLKRNSKFKVNDIFKQESGRAGRDDEKAYCIVFWRLADLFRLSTMTFTERTGLRNLYSMVAYCLDVNRVLSLSSYLNDSQGFQRSFIQMQAPDNSWTFRRTLGILIVQPNVRSLRQPGFGSIWLGRLEHRRAFRHAQEDTGAGEATGNPSYR